MTSTATRLDLATLVASRIDQQQTGGIAPRRWTARVWQSPDGSIVRVYVTYRTHRAVECGYVAITEQGTADRAGVTRDEPAIYQMARIATDGSGVIAE